MIIDVSLANCDLAGDPLGDLALSAAALAQSPRRAYHFPGPPPSVGEFTRAHEKRVLAFRPWLSPAGTARPRSRARWPLRDDDAGRTARIAAPRDVAASREGPGPRGQGLRKDFRGQDTVPQSDGRYCPIVASGGYFGRRSRLHEEDL